MLYESTTLITGVKMCKDCLSNMASLVASIKCEIKEVKTLTDAIVKLEWYELILEVALRQEAGLLKIDGQPPLSLSR
jgi:hypothetical protein